MSATDNSDLTELRKSHPSINKIAEAVESVWPEHARYIAKSLSGRDSDTLATTELLAEAVLRLAGDRLETVAHHYRWTCDRLREEELFFHRNDRYRLSTFEEADREVYSNSEYMQKYVDGLLFSQILWSNHAASCHFYFKETPRFVAPGGRMLEIGPGHGLMVYLAMREFGLADVTAWDISPVSVEHTRHALSELGVTGATLQVQDIMSVPDGTPPANIVVLSEILEHLEDPVAAMERIRPLVADDGVVFVNVPINSPSPDHLYLMRTLDDARMLLRETGFDIVSENAFATQGHAIDKALRNKISISVCMFGRPRLD
ncbi:class I SAM-dependent methyltransferase [Roseibium album]|uniref:class I SAM-dependent methyltransferase n=1 Tax=Roseibium album TaxID=311410 RepID=UPI0024918490|nr:class I SAM-dependent methyltransferase [Roseibium album]